MADELEGARTLPVRFRDQGDGSTAEVIDNGAAVRVPKGYEQITGITGSTVKALSGATGAKFAIVIPKVTGRWRDDGTDPTSTVGMPLTASQPMRCDQNVLTAVRFKDVDTLDVVYYA